MVNDTYISYDKIIWYTIVDIGVDIGVSHPINYLPEVTKYEWTNKNIFNMLTCFRFNQKLFLQ